MSQAQEFHLWMQNSVTQKLLRAFKEELEYSKSAVSLSIQTDANRDQMNVRVGKLYLLNELTDEQALFRRIFAGEEESQNGK